MDATTLSPDAQLPDDVPTLQARVRELLTELQKLRAENAELKTKLDAVLKHRFGRRSERRTPRRCPPPRSCRPDAMTTVVHRCPNTSNAARSSTT